MQVLRQHKKIVLIAVLLVIILIVSLFIAQNISKPSPTTTSSPTPTALSAPTPTPILSLYPGEVTQYQEQRLTTITDFLDDIDQHPDVAIEGTQYINPATYNLTITGLVNKTVQYSYDDVVNNFTAYQQVATLLCVEGWSVTMLWQGVSVNDLLQAAGASPNATTVIFSASDGYSTELPLNYIVQNNLILAYKLNNVTLPAAAGFPFALVAQNQYGYKWIKWVTEIDVSNDSSYLGYWESRGYPNNATVSGGSNILIQLGDIVSVAEAIVVSVVVILIVAAIYRIYRRSKPSSPNSGVAETRIRKI
ncbi:MAG: molybdopterin-dependent oxidoreductase [Candidatus Bathyarchaeia archaeon]|jgi:DMSO/TMAO reductase YedYZ molybdopterin-dependent catalytic subunit